MTIILTHLDEALDCVQALYAAGRPYTINRTIAGEFVISTVD